MQRPATRGEGSSREPGGDGDGSAIPQSGGGPRFSRLRFTLTLALCTVVVLLSITAWWAERRLSGPLSRSGALRATYSAQAAINRAVERGGRARLDGADLIRLSREKAGRR